jgi:ubiquitin-conjugating enzyme E2 D/E
MNQKLYREFLEFKKNPSPAFKALPKLEKTLREDGSVQEDFDFSKWNIILTGGESTPYAERKFQITMEFPVEYPYKPPRVIFNSKIFHPNISVNGDVCIDILKQNWSPVLGIEKIILSILSLMAEPNANDPLNQEAGRLYLENRDLFVKRAKDF